MHTKADLEAIWWHVSVSMSQLLEDPDSRSNSSVYSSGNLRYVLVFSESQFPDLLNRNIIYPDSKLWNWWDHVI